MSFMLRPSSQTAPSRPSGNEISDTNPCSVCVPSRCGTIGLVQLWPPSFDREMFTLYAYVPAPLLTSQCAANEPSFRSITDGKSAQLTNQLSPSETVRASPHPFRSSAAVRKAYREIGRAHV